MATHMTSAERFLIENRIECPFPKGNIELVSMEVAFKALKMSNKSCIDDDKIKRVLIDYFEDMKKADCECYGISPDTIISWLKTR